MTIVIKGDKAVGVVDAENHAGAECQKPDPQHAREHWHKKPVTGIGDEFALAPPRGAGIAGPEMREHRKDEGEHDRDRNYLFDGLTEHLDDFQE